VIGTAEHPEIAYALSQAADFTEVEVAANVVAAIERGESTLATSQAAYVPPPHFAAPSLLDTQPRDPDAVMLVRVHRDDFSAADALSLRRAFPLAPIVAICGAWLDGETRSGQPPPGVILEPWWRFGLAAARHAHAAGCGRPGPWSLATTFTPDERFEWFADDEACFDASPPRGTAVISTAHHVTFAGLCDVLKRWGFSCVWRRPGERIDVAEGAVGVWDGATRFVDHGDLAEFCGTFRAPVVALLDVMRLGDVQTAQRAGASFVLRKLTLLADLRMAVEAAAARSLRLGASARERL